MHRRALPRHSRTACLTSRCGTNLALRRAMGKGKMEYLKFKEQAHPGGALKQGKPQGSKFKKRRDKQSVRTQKMNALRARLVKLLDARFPASWAAMPSQKQLTEACREAFSPCVMAPTQYGFASAAAMSKWLHEEAGAHRASAPHPPGVDVPGATSEAQGVQGVQGIQATQGTRSTRGVLAEVEEALASLSWRAPRVSAGPHSSRLHRDLVHLASIATPDAPAMDRRCDALARVVEVVREAYPAARLDVFGSSSTDLTLPSSDVDLVASLAGARSAKKPLRRLEAALKHTGGFRDLTLVLGAKVPLLKFVHQASRLSFDLCTNSTNGVENSAFIRRHLEGYPALRPLVLALKCTLQQAGLHDTFTGGIGSFLLFLMVLRVLQRIRERGDEASFEVGPHDRVGDLGLQLRAVVRTYAQSRTLEICDPLSSGEHASGQKEIGSKAFRYAEVQRLLGTIDARLDGTTGLSAVLRGWPVAGADLPDHDALVHLCKSTFRKPPQGRTLLNRGGGGARGGARGGGARYGQQPGGDRRGSQERRGATKQGEMVSAIKKPRWRAKRKSDARQFSGMPLRGGGGKGGAGGKKSWYGSKKKKFNVQDVEL